MSTSICTDVCIHAGYPSIRSEAVSGAPPVEVPEPRGLSVLWYSLLVVGMRILHHASPGWTTYTSRHTPLPEHSVLWYSILVRHVGGVPLIGTATVLCLLPMEPMVPHLLRYPTDTCATRTSSCHPMGVVSHVGFTQYLVPHSGLHTTTQGWYPYLAMVLCTSTPGR